MEIKVTKEQSILPQMANRHGMIAGATGTGKTVSLQLMAEQFSEIGVPVFLADVKGDLSGLAKESSRPAKIEPRLKLLSIENKYTPKAYPVKFWDVHREYGQPISIDIMKIQPMLLAKLLNLNDVQTGVLNIVYKILKAEGNDDVRDLEEMMMMIRDISEDSAYYSGMYGYISKSSLGAIHRGLMDIEEQSAGMLFGNQSGFKPMDLIETPGLIHILCADKLINNPKVYSIFLLWMLMDLYEKLPEVGDLEKPKLVFFFDEAHLLFADTAKHFIQKIEQVVRLIRSKGVGVYFVSQSPMDIPDNVLGQLGNKVQHALRAFTPKDQRMVRAVAQNFRENYRCDAETEVKELAVGEALVSFLDERGVPQPVERALMYPPRSQMGPLTIEERAAIVGTIKTIEQEKAERNYTPPTVEEMRAMIIANGGGPSVDESKPKTVGQTIKKVWNSDMGQKAGIAWLLYKILK